MPYEFVEHVGEAGFIVKNKDLEKLFEEAGIALEHVQIQNIENIEKKVEKTFTKEANNLEQLLFDFLDELVFLKDVESLIFGKFEIKISNEKNNYFLKAKCFGEKINFEKHNPRADVKAITWHNFKLEKKNNVWFAKVIVDV